MSPTPLVSSLHWVALLATAMVVIMGIGWLFLEVGDALAAAEAFDSPCWKPLERDQP